MLRPSQTRLRPTPCRPHATAVAAILCLATLGGCATLQQWGINVGGDDSNASGLPPVEEADISSLSREETNIVAPRERGDGTINPDRPHLVVLRDRDGRIERIWVGGRRSHDRIAIACYEALMRLTDKPAAEQTRIPTICNNLPKRDIKAG